MVSNLTFSNLRHKDLMEHGELKAEREVVSKNFKQHVNWRVNVIKDAIGSAIPEYVLEEQSWSILEGQFKYLYDEDLARHIFETVNHPATTAENYFSKLVATETSSGLGGIRFRLMDGKFEPYLNFYSTSFASSDPDVLGEETKALVRQLKSKFEIFGPKEANIILPVDSLGPSFDGYIEDYYVGGVVKSSNNPKRTTEGIKLVPVEDPERTYKLYEKAYDDFHGKEPHLISHVHKNSREHFLEHLTDGWGYDAKVGDTWVGMTIITPNNFFCGTGAVVTDIIIAPQLWGKGLGGLIHKELQNELAEREITYLHGTIHKTNYRSLYSARKAGRNPILSIYRLPARDSESIK